MEIKPNHSLFVIIIILFFVSACGSKQDVASHMQNAKQYQKENKLNAAIIELKNALQQEPNNIQARKLLGTIYLDSGNGLSAEKEIRKAISLGIAKEELMTELAKSLVLQQEYDQAQKVLYVNDDFSADKKNEIYILQGDIYFAKSDTKNAENSYKNALAARKNDSAAIIGLAKLSLINADIKQTEKIVAAIDEADKNYIDKLLILAEVATRQNNLGDAERLYTEIIDKNLAKNSIQKEFFVRDKLVRLLTYQDQIEKALKHVNHMMKVAPNSPMPMHLRGLVAYRNKDYDVALEYLQQVEAKTSKHLQTTLLLGASHFAKGNYEQSNRYLTKFINEKPSHLQARKLLSQVRLRLNKPSEAVDVLKVAVNENQGDADLLTMIGKAATASGDTKLGESYLRKAIKAEPNSPEIRSELAKVYLKQGAYDSAIDELKTIPGDDEIQTKLLLVYSYLKKEDFKKAKSTIKTLIKVNPKNATLWTVSGGVQLISGNKEEARKHFNKALEYDKNFTVALLNLARMDLKDSQLAEAGERYNTILRENENNVSALMGMAKLSEQSGDIDKAITWLEKAHIADKSAVTPRLVLGRHHLKTGNPEKTISVLEDSDSSFMNNLALLRIHTSALLKLGRSEQAINNYRKAIESFPKNPQLLLEIAAIYNDQKNYSQAKSALTKAMALKKDFLEAEAVLAVIEMQMGNFENALKLTTQIKKHHGKSAVGYTISGDIYSAQKKFKQARSSYQQGFKHQPSGILITKIHQASKNLNDHDHAIKVLTDWLKLNPNDIPNRLNLALTYQTSQQNKKAELEYKNILQSQPKNILVLNNLAYLLINKDIKSALNYAKQAYDIKSDNFAIMDTYAWILLKSGDTSTSLTILKDAVDKSRGAPSIRYHYAVALTKDNKSKQARKELKDILDANSSFPEREAAKKLLASLK